MSARTGEFRTRSYVSLEQRDVPPDALVIYAKEGTEDRSVLPIWAQRQTSAPERCLAISEQTADTAVFDIPGATAARLSLRDLGPVGELARKHPRVFMDISGLQHTVWAPLLKEVLPAALNLSVVYAEPVDYRLHTSPTSSSIFDLTEAFQGIGPLPGFSKLRGPDEESLSLLVPFLGFEGARARQVAATLDPIPRVVPVVGVPGFQVEYPAHTVSCNRDFLGENRCFGAIRFARASCPFEAYDLLEEIHAAFPEYYMYIAPVGTKPHALGAVLFAMNRGNEVEIMYDHPRRKAKRTSGVSLVHVYSVKTT